MRYHGAAMKANDEWSAMYCPECGAEVREGARFCPECGHPMGAAAPSRSNAGASSDGANGNEAAGPGARTESPVGDGFGSASRPFGDAQPPQPEPPRYAAPANVVHAKSRVTAGLLGIFLGWLGLHKFYLGYTAPGLIMLIAFFVLCYFNVGFIMVLFGFVEGLIYLTKTDQEFYRLYVAHQKEWF